MNPTYRDLGGHTEAFQVDFDPTVIAYADLLELFWGAHDPSFRVRSSQYKPAIFWHTDEQRRLAEETAAREARNTGRPVVTEILAASAFYRAEDYHQKYYLKRETPWTKALAAIYPEANDFTDSTAAARLNGLAGGHGSLAELRPQLAPLQGI